MYKNSENYYDPTAGEALSRVMSDYKKERSDRRKAERKRNSQAKKDELTAQYNELSVHKNRTAEEYRNQPKVYVVSPYAGDVAKNTSAAVRYCRYVIDAGMVPVASHLLYPQILNDRNPDERELGLACGLSLMALCDEVWVFGRNVSSGMAREITEARKLEIPLRYVEV